MPLAPDEPPARPAADSPAAGAPACDGSLPPVPAEEPALAPTSSGPKPATPSESLVAAAPAPAGEGTDTPPLPAAAGATGACFEQPEMATNRQIAIDCRMRDPIWLFAARCKATRSF